MSSSYEPPIQVDLVRERLRQSGRLPERQVALHNRDGAYRTTIMAVAMDEYDSVPESYRQIYDPETHCIILDLPDPKNRETTLEDF